MPDVAVKNLKALEKARADIARKCYPAFDELLLYSLERRHLDVPEYSDILLSSPETDGAPSLKDRLQKNVRLFKLDEIAFDANEKFHLPGVESALTAMHRIAERLSLGKSMTYRILGDMKKRGMVVQEGHGGGVASSQQWKIGRTCFPLFGSAVCSE